MAVGRDEDILGLSGPDTQRLDLDGKTVLPGLIDSHTHPLGAAMYEFDHAVPDMETIADVLDYFRQRAEVVPEGGWIRLQQVFITRLREQRYPTRAELDDVAPNHAAYFRTGPDASLNSLALELSGIDRDFRIPQGSLGRIERDSNGDPTGIIRSGAHLIAFRESQKPPTREDKRRRPQGTVRRLQQGRADQHRGSECQCRGRRAIRGPAGIWRADDSRIRQPGN